MIYGSTIEIVYEKSDFVASFFLEISQKQAQKAQTFLIKKNNTIFYRI